MSHKVKEEPIRVDGIIKDTLPNAVFKIEMLY
jgi:translation initiation factor IF-1